MDFDLKLLIGIWWAIQQISCQVNWILDTDIEPDHEPLIGKNVRLNCTATGCCANTREWAVEISGTYTVIVLGGTSNNITKYEEDLHTSTNQFNLIIKDFQESDLKNYRCRYQFLNDAHSLQMSDGLHYLPSESDKTEVIKDFTSSTNTFSYTLNITSVYPDPSCTSSYGEDDLTSSMTKTVTDNGNFKSVLLQFSNVAHSCSGVFIIQCTVGSYSNQQFANFEPCQQEDEGGLSVEASAGIGTGSAVVGGGCVACIVAVVIIMIKGTITVYVKKGHGITFGESLNTSDVQWKKDGKKVELKLVVGTRCKVEKASEEHEGLYVCTSGKYKQKYRLIVLDDIVYIDKSLDKECCLGPSQMDKNDAVWKKDGKALKSIRSSEIKLSVKDEGLYICILKSAKKQFKYYVIAVGTEEIVYGYQGHQTEFGKTIPDENTTKNAQWTKDNKKVESHHSERTKFEIAKSCGQDEGLFVCTFGQNNMKLTYQLVVVGTEEIVYGYQGDQTEFGKTIPDESTTKNAQWTKDSMKVESHDSKRTKFKIDKTCGEDEGIYVCTFGQNNMKLTYHLIVVGTVESFSVNEGDTVKFGKDIPNKLDPSNAKWTNNDKEIKSDNIKGTVIEIKNAVKKDSGLYELTFEPPNMKCQYRLTVLRTEEIVYASPGLPIEFGKIIPDKNTTENARWTKIKKTVASDHSERTKFKINNTCEKDEGLYVCTFGPNNIKLKYYLIVVGTVESFSVHEGNAITFGKDIPFKSAPTKAKWTTYDKKEIKSDHIKGTMIQISNTEEKDGGLYELTFGPNNMKCQYKLTVLKSESEDGNETVRKLRKKEAKLENGAAEKVPPATVKDVDETPEKLPHSGRLPPVETPGYIGRSALDRKTLGTPLPPLSSIPVESNH